jgi:hypothetical protein
MKTSIRTWSTFGFAALALAGALTACGKKDEGSAAVDGRARVAGTSAAPVNPAGYVAKGTYVKSTASTAGSSMSSSQFARNVKDFITSSWDPAGLGLIDDESFIIQGYLEMTNATDFNLASSNLKIWVQDDYAKDKIPMENGQPATPYFINMKNATSGKITGNQFTLLFKDDYQEITLAGTFDASTVSGTLSFKNLKDALSGEMKSASPMGYFSVSSCAILNCRKQ